MASSDLTFGPPGDQWHYKSSHRTYDLTRGSPGPPLKIKTTRGPEDTHISISPSLSALVIVDMQNFFIHPSCREHPMGLAAVEPTLKVISKCRQLGIQERSFPSNLSAFLLTAFLPSPPSSPWTAYDLL